MHIGDSASAIIPNSLYSPIQYHFKQGFERGTAPLCFGFNEFTCDTKGPRMAFSSLFLKNTCLFLVCDGSLLKVLEVQHDTSDRLLGDKALINQDTD